MGQPCRSNLYAACGFANIREEGGKKKGELLLVSSKTPLEFYWTPIGNYILLDLCAAQSYNVYYEY